MEALLSIAGYAYEHPADPFPEIAEREPVFDATEMAHPLIPAAEAGRNSLARTVITPSCRRQASGPDRQRLEHVGQEHVDADHRHQRVLALAGAPVRAHRLRLTPLAIGTCLRHTDSLQEHRSGFYTEALRIRRIYDLLNGPLPVLFLFDELLSGTNSRIAASPPKA